MPLSIRATARAWLTLWLGAALSLALYWWRWTRTFPLTDLYDVAWVDIGSLTHYAKSDAALWVGAFAALFTLYVLAARAVRVLGEDRRALPAVLAAASAFGLALAFTFPLTALDVYGYLFQGRLMAHYQANPYLVPPANFAGDPWLRFLAWPHETAAYGPLWLWLSALGAIVSGGDLLRGLLVCKLGALAAVPLCAWATYRLLMPRGRGEALAGALLVAWNPLILFETAVNGHNDAVMALLAVLALLAQARDRTWLAYPLLAASVLIKFFTAPLLPAFLAQAAKAARWRLAGLWQVCLGLLLAAGVVLVCYWPLWAGPQSLGFLQRGDLFTASPAALAYHLLGGPANPEASNVVKLACLALLLAFAFWRYWRVSSAVHALAAAACDLLLAYLALGAFWFQPWYVVVLVPFAVISGGFRRLVGLIWSASALTNYLLFNYLWLWYPDWFDEIRLQTVALALIYAPPVLALLWSLRPARRPSTQPA